AGAGVGAGAGTGAGAGAGDCAAACGVAESSLDHGCMNTSPPAMTTAAAPAIQGQRRRGAALGIGVIHAIGVPDAVVGTWSPTSFSMADLSGGNLDSARRLARANSDPGAASTASRGTFVST